MGPGRGNRKRGRGRPRTKTRDYVPMETSQIDSVDNQFSDASADIKPLITPKAFNSLRSLVLCEIGSESSDISLVKKEIVEGQTTSQPIAMVKIKTEVMDEEVPVINGGLVESPAPQISTGSLNDSQNTEGQALCKVVDPRQIRMEHFLDPQSSDCDNAQESNESKPSNGVASLDNPGDDVTTPSLSEMGITAYQNGVTLDISKALHPGDDVPPTSLSEMGITAYQNGVTMDISKALLHEVDSSEMTDILLENASSETSGTFDSLRQLADNFLASSSQAPPSKRDVKRRGRRSKKCDLCGHKSKTIGDADKHKKYKHGPSVYPCPVSGCSFTTKYPNNIRHHKNSAHNQERPFSCTECSKSFKRKNQLETHMSTHSDERPFACKLCDFRTKRNWILTTHMSTVHSEQRPFECEVCNFKVKTRNDLIKHKRIHAKRERLSCPHCTKTFSFKSSLKKHIDYNHTDIDLIPCTVKDCDRKFKNKWALAKHVTVVHEGVRRFECDICKHLFSNKANLELHIVVHETENRPFKCPLCSFRFREEFHLRAHLGSMHKMKHIGVFKCDACQLRFKTNGGLSQHLRTAKHRRNARLARRLQKSQVQPDPSPAASDMDQPEQPEIKIEVVFD